jgi:hypothetical protein
VNFEGKDADQFLSLSVWERRVAMSCTIEWAEEHVCSHGPLEHWYHGTAQFCRIIKIPNMDHEFESIPVHG